MWPQWLVTNDLVYGLAFITIDQKSSHWVAIWQVWPHVACYQQDFVLRHGLPNPPPSEW